MSQTPDELSGTVVATADASDDESVESKQYERRIRALDNQLRTLDNQLRVLDRERRKFSAIVHHADVGLALVESEEGVTWANSTFIERYSPTRPKDRVTLGARCHQAICRKRTPCEGCPTRRMFETGQVAHHELSLPLEDRFHPIYVTAVPLHAPGGAVEQAILMLQDLSGLETLQKSDEAVRSSEQRYRAIFEQAGAGIVTLRADGSFLQVNPIFATMVGYTESQLLQTKLSDVIDPADRPAFDSAMGSAGSNRQVVENEFRFTRRDGTFLWCHTTSLWSVDETGKAAYCVVLIQDVSERKRAERALEQSQRRYEALVHSIDGIVWEADPRAFRFSFVSKQAERILGHPVSRWLTQPRFWRNQIHPQDLDRVVNALGQAVGERHGHEFEYRMIAEDGRTVWIRDSVTPVIEKDKVTKLRGLMVDVTERKAAEEALRHSEEQLRQSQKMEAIGRLAGGIAHDFNNLLTAITGYGDLLIKRLGDSPLRREAQEISKAAQRAADLTGQLLAFSRQQVLQPKVFDLKSIVSDMEMMLRRVIGEHVELITCFDLETGAVRADPGQINQVLLNLVVNARDAMADGGRITVALSDVELDEAYAMRHPGITAGPHVMLAVSDEGSGMTEETRVRLFEPFFTTKEQGKGTGLGLSTVYGIVKQSGGHISVESEIDEGTTFRIYLPRVEEAATQPIERSEPETEVAMGTERILLVEDDDSVRDLAREILEMSGYSVIEACNGVEALSVFEQADEDVELMVTDLVMPQLGGRELARRVIPENPGMRVLFLSGYTDSVVLQQGLLDPGSFFLQKPFTPDALARKVREALDT